MIGYVTLDVGEQFPAPKSVYGSGGMVAFGRNDTVFLGTHKIAIIYSLGGQARIEEGPQRIFLWREKYRVLTRFSANQNEYLIVRFLDGCIEHIKGPHVLFSNPTRHSSIMVEKMISLDANEAIVVYSQDKDTGNVQRYIKYGPCQYMPGANEWLHQFQWHGTDPDNKTRVIKDANRFQKIKIIPDQFYYNVDEVRTADDALIRVKLMMFFELVDIEKMLSATHDPVADFVNCLCADVVAFASQRTYMGFIEQSSELNDLHQYPQLLERCKAIGFVVSKVVFRGYYAHEKLQKLHDTAIDKRSRLRIQFEQEEQSQVLTDVKLQNEMQRMKQEQDMELEQLTHQQRLEREKLIHSLNLQKKEAADRLAKNNVEKQANLNAQKAEQSQELDHLRKLSELKVSLTNHLVSGSNRPATVTRIKATAPTIHLHHTGQGNVLTTSI